MDILVKISKVGAALSLLTGIVLSGFWANILAAVGWGLALVYFIKWIENTDEIEKHKAEIIKIRKQDSETFEGLWAQIEKDRQITTELQTLNDFLISVLEHGSKDRRDPS